MWLSYHLSILFCIHPETFSCPSRMGTCADIEKIMFKSVYLLLPEGF